MGNAWGSELDVFDFLNEVEDESLDGVLTDLPYPTTERHRARGTTTRTKASKSSSNAWYSVLSIDQLADVLSLLYDKLRPNSYLFAYVDDSTYLLLAQCLGVIGDLERLTQPGVANSRAPKDVIGFGWWNPCTWVKTTLDSGRLTDWWTAHGGDGTPPAAKWNDHHAVKLRGGSGYHPPGGACTERILMLEKGKRRLEPFYNAFLDPRPRAKPQGATRKSASAKPVRIAEILTRAMADEGGTICDPFVGCGNHAAGIVRAGCDALVNDVDLSIARDWLPNVHGLELHDWNEPLND